MEKNDHPPPPMQTLNNNSQTLNTLTLNTTLTLNPSQTLKSAENHALELENNTHIREDGGETSKFPREQENVGGPRKEQENAGGARREEEEVGPRERLKRHRKEVAGQVWIPEMWGQEDFLKDWIDCGSFDSRLINHQDIVSARASLAEEGRKASSGRLRVQNSC